MRRIINWYFSRKALPYWCILVMDCVIVFLSGLFVFYLQHGWADLVSRFAQVSVGLLVSLILYIVSFFVFHTYNGVMRYSSFVDLHRVAYSTAVAGVGVCLLHQVQVYLGLSQYILIPRVDSAIMLFIVATMLMWCLRVVVKGLHDSYRGDGTIKKVFVYGCMEGGVALAKSLRNESPQRYRLGGFITTDKTLHGTWLLGEKVYLDDDSLVRTMEECHVSAVLVSPLQREYFITRTTFIDALINAGIKILITPAGAEEWDGKSDISYQQLRFC